MTFRSEKWRRAVVDLEYCVRCGRYGVQCAHRDEGKGMGLKTDDCLSAALCPECHRELGEGKDMTRDERRREMDRAIIVTIQRLVNAGKLKVA